ncbi:disulfide bond formation protein B [Alicyclobacillus fructus]|uniref:disulfide bond formation protein B n=1 Tax=Alicyclobacillus fructus TaxID=2816082 RepID=UPI001F3BE42A|nr:disulfide bond formation protein B [Alicyclobacillus fructus]
MVRFFGWRASTRRALGILIPAVALSVSAYWSLLLHWRACAMCWSERLLLVAALLGWFANNRWMALFAPLLGFGIASAQWWMQLHAVRALFCSVTTPCDVSYLHLGPLTTAGLADLVFFLLLLLGVDSFAHRPKRAEMIPFPRKAE